jgi:hypothetical protein
MEGTGPGIEITGGAGGGICNPQTKSSSLAFINVCAHKPCG